LIGKWAFDDNQNFQISILILLLGLLMLNFYWTILFFRMGYRYAVKGEVKDLQNPVEDLKRKKLKSVD